MPIIIQFPQLPLASSVGSSWFTPDANGLNDRQYTIRRLSTLGRVLSPDASPGLFFFFWKALTFHVI